MIRCPFCKFVSDECDVCDGFGWFIPDDPNDTLSDDLCENNHNISKKPNFTLKKAIEQDPVQSLAILSEWFSETSDRLSDTTGSYIFYRDIAILLFKCRSYLHDLDRYENVISGSDDPSCIMTMWKLQ